MHAGDGREVETPFTNFVTVAFTAFCSKHRLNLLFKQERFFFGMNGSAQAWDQYNNKQWYKKSYEHY